MKIFKLMTVALAVGAMVSCSDDLGLESQNLKATKGGLSATIDSPVDRMATRLAVNQAGGVQGGAKSVVFGNEEKLRVFTLNQLQQDLYQIEQGQGGNSTADFNQIVNNNLTGQLYAVTEASSVYGISAYQDGAEAKPLLTLTLPGSYNSETDNAGLKNFPIPFWGPATVNGGNEFSTNKNLSAKLTGLTAILRVSADKLPAGTKAIVLTTHGRRDLMQYENGANKEGFQIVTPEEKNQITGFNDLNSWWEDNVPYTLGGKSEPISGTLNCILDKDNIEDTYLKVDQVYNGEGYTWADGTTEGSQYASRLVTSDTLRVNLPKYIANTGSTAYNQVFYIPIVVGHYENLRVLAVTEDSKYTYRWVGYEIYNFVDQTFERNKPYYLDLNVIELGHAAISKVNWAIQQYNNTAGRTTLIDVDLLDKDGSGMPNQPTDYIAIHGAGNVILNFDEIGELPNNIATTRENPLVIKNRQNNYYDNASTTAAHQVEIYVPGDWNDVEQEEQEDEVSNFVKVLLGDANVVLGTSDKMNSEKTVFEVLNANTQYVSGHNFDRNKLDIYDSKDAGLIVKNGFKEIAYLPKNTGDIYVYNDESNEEELEINDVLDIQTNSDIDIRLTDAMIKKLEFSGRGPVDIRFVYTTGSTAIGALINGFGQEYKDPNLNDFDVVNLADDIAAQAQQGQDVEAGVTMVTDNTNDGAPNKVVIQAYWTGKSLSYTAIQKGYDVSTVYTAAQLASVGEGGKELNLFNPYTEQPMILGANTTPYTAHYVIPKDVIDFIWLGDDHVDSKGRSWRWIGAEVTVDGFTLNGENTRLVNMWLLTQKDGDKYWSDDPHICCTSCINLPAAQTPKVALTERLGLMRSIINTDTASVQWINLNEVMYENEDPNRVVKYVGAITGYVESPKVNFDHNYVGEVKLIGNIENVGGQVGKIVAETSLNMDHNEVAGHSNKSGVISSEQNFVGGHVGSIEAGTTTYNDNRSDLHAIYGKQNYVGGHVGKFTVTGDIVADGNITVTTKFIKADGNHAGGHFGQLIASNNQRAVDEGEGVNVQANGNVTWVKESIIAGGNYAGGHMGELLASGNVVENGNDIKVDENIETGGKYVAGLDGYAEVQGTFTANENTVEVDNIRANGEAASSSYAGGLFGHLWAKKHIDLLTDQVTAGSITGVSGFVGGFAGRIWGWEDALTNDASVAVTNNIEGTRYVGGLYGDSELLNSEQEFNIYDADVTAGLIKGANANVGGIHGRACTGQFHIGYNDPRGAYNRDYFVKVEIDSIAGGYAVGGLVGENQSTSNRSPLFINDGPSTTWKNASRKYYTQIIVNVKKWGTTKVASYFTNEDTPRNYAGTFGNILGLMHGNLFVDELWGTPAQPGQLTKATTYGTQTYLVVYENLTSAKKAEVHFRLHNDQQHNLGYQQFYWGDGNGYIGWNATQQYEIDGVLQRGEQLDLGPMRWGHNLFLKDYDDTEEDAGYPAYADAITKLQ